MKVYYIGHNRYRVKVFPVPLLGRVKICISCFISAADGWCGLAEFNADPGYSDSAYLNIAKARIREIEALP